MRLLSKLLLSAAVCLIGIAHSLAQEQPSESLAQQGSVSITSLAKPTYPPLARSARVMGDVQLELKVRADGTVESAVVLSGHEMLRETALESVRNSKFACLRCGDAATSYTLTYSFKLAEACESPLKLKPDEVRVEQKQNQVTVTVASGVVIPYFSYVRVRSVKCLYLWRCGSYSGALDYYNYRVRSPKCLGLWKCGLKPRPKLEADCD